mgnify:CR=1 FL=1
MIPLAKLIDDSTEHLSTHYDSTLGSLSKVTFGNATETIIEVIAINAGLLEFVNASITGSILGSIMLIFGLSMITRGLRHKEQLFNKENADAILISFLGTDRFSNSYNHVNYYSECRF